MNSAKKHQKNSHIHKEAENFLNNLNFIKANGKIFAIGKNAPSLFEIKPDDFICWKDKSQISADLLNDFTLLKRFAYIPPPKPLQWQNSDGAKAVMSFHISHECNMNCRYCFLKEAMPHSKIKLMRPGLARKAVGFFFNRISVKSALIVFIGGEPLLNLPAIKAALEEVKKFPEYDIRFGIVTNGTLLDKETALFLQANKIRIIISYDCIKEENDKNRPLKDGRASSDVIMKNIRLLKQLGIEIWSLKITISQDSPYSVRDFAQSMIKLPINPRRIATVRQHGVQTGGLKRKAPVTLEILEQVKDWLGQGKRLKDLPLNGSEWMFYWFIQPRQRMTMDSCGLDNNKILVTPNGDIYMCDVVVNKEEFRLGNIEQGIDDDKLEDLRKRCFISPDYCRDCWIKFFCHKHCLFVRQDRVRRAASCASLRAQFKKVLEIFPVLGFHDMISICFPIGTKGASDRLTKPLSVAYGLRSVLQEKTTALKPLNIFPYNENYDKS